MLADWTKAELKTQTNDVFCHLRSFVCCRCLVFISYMLKQGVVLSWLADNPSLWFSRTSAWAGSHHPTLSANHHRAETVSKWGHQCKMAAPVFEVLWLHVCREGGSGEVSSIFTHTSDQTTWCWLTQWHDVIGPWALGSSLQSLCARLNSNTCDHSLVHQEVPWVRSLHHLPGKERQRETDGEL